MNLERATAYLRNVDLCAVSRQEVMSRIGLGTKALRRRGICYRSLLEQERKRRTMAALESCPGLGFDELTDIMGYQDKQSAQRAFVALFGKTLTQWRQDAGQENS